MREHNGKNVVMWRDYTRQERENMNENLDAGMRFTVYLANLLKDFRRVVL